VDWDGLAIIAFAIAFGFFSWRWSVPYNESIYKMVHGGNAPKPGTWMSKSLAVGRWLGVAFSGLLIVLVVSSWLTSL